MVAEQDARFMARALFLAERGLGRTAPNPIVGAVVATPDGVVVGQGAHLAAGLPHAEVVALDAAGPRARGATLYCTLEPCCHTGRTGPCVDRIAAAGITRVVAATRDRNPQVQGAGLEWLRAHGIAVDEGVGAAEANRQHAPFFCWVTRRRPFVTLKTAVSADGFVGRSGERVKLTAAVADRFLQRQRAAVDAIAVGSGTVLTDDPVLTVRLTYRAKPFVRIIFDWNLRVSPSARLFSTLPSGPVIMVVSAATARAQSERVARLEDQGATVERVETQDLTAILGGLAARGILSLLVEGGPALHARFLAEGMADRIQRVVTPHRLGEGMAAAAGMDLPITAGTAARHWRLGEDTLWEADVHRVD
jgi:diaminohydroxyphosphoribosylaminopyrimidine deaminase/5-amino-6-(5-phosphoribosylamino)uracil reductase